MMWQYLTQEEIDKEAWNNCIENSKQRIVYALSWYLDIVCPSWSALVRIDGEKYTAVIPLPEKRFFLFKFLYQPFFTQQLGLFSLKGNNDKELLREAIAVVRKKYLRISYQLNEQNIELLEDTGCFKRLTHLLELNHPYADIARSYSDNVKRNIRKAEASGLQEAEPQEILSLINLFRKAKGTEISELKDKDYETVRKLYTEAQKRGIGFVKYIRKDEELCAGGFFLHHLGRIIYLFGISSDLGKESGAMMLLMDSVIKQYAETKNILDFEGSDMEGLARFYRSFGSQPVHYPAYRFSRI